MMVIVVFIFGRISLEMTKEPHPFTGAQSSNPVFQRRFMACQHFVDVFWP